MHTYLRRNGVYYLRRLNRETRYQLVLYPVNLEVYTGWPILRKTLVISENADGVLENIPSACNLKSLQNNSFGEKNYIFPFFNFTFVLEFDFQFRSAMLYGVYFGLYKYNFGQIAY